MKNKNSDSDYKAEDEGSLFILIIKCYRLCNRW